MAARMINTKLAHFIASLLSFRRHSRARAQRGNRESINDGGLTVLPHKPNYAVSPSPRRLKESTVRKIASPGHTAIQGAVERKRCAELSMLPQDGAGGCWPSPRQDRLASAMMAVA